MVLTAREKKLLRELFSRKSVARLVNMFPETTPSEWEILYDKLMERVPAPGGLILYVDGSSDPQSGSAGIGGVLFQSGKDGNRGKELLTFSDNIGKATNNEAEYRALISGLEHARDVSTGPLSIFSDSELLVKQLSLEYKIKSERLIKLYSKSKKLLDRFQSWEIHHVARGDNKKADILSKQAHGLKGGRSS